MKVEAMQATGGFIAPASPGLTMAEAARKFSLFNSVMPVFSAVRGGIDFRPPHVRWAIQREREMRALTKMWNWP
jgi:hypothetical protein